MVGVNCCLTPACAGPQAHVDSLEPNTLVLSTAAAAAHLCTRLLSAVHAQCPQADLTHKRTHLVLSTAVTAPHLCMRLPSTVWALALGLSLCPCSTPPSCCTRCSLALFRVTAIRFLPFSSRGGFLIAWAAAASSANSM